MSTEVEEGGVIFDDVGLEHDGKVTIMFDPESNELVIGLRGIDRLGITTVAANGITPEQAEDYGYALLRAVGKVRTALAASS